MPLSDPLTPTPLLLESLRARLPAAADVFASSVQKGLLSKVDLLCIEDHLRVALSATVGLRQRTEHHKPISTNDDKTTPSC